MITNDLWVTNLYKQLASEEKKSRQLLAIEPNCSKNTLETRPIAIEYPEKLVILLKKDLGSQSP